LFELRKERLEQMPPSHLSERQIGRTPFARQSIGHISWSKHHLA
jgi:hypothetical protein